ncbi:MAG: 30S ribosomal protein S12 methylthiotransferase RimO [bacterium]
MKIKLITLGCPKNIVDSEFLQGGLQACGVEFVDQPHEAEAVIINTCGFIESAKEESIDTILQAVKLKKNGRVRRVFVTGCLSERYAPDLRREIPEVDAYFGNRDLPVIVKSIAQQLRLKYELLGERQLLTPRHYAYLKISEGCEHPCTFCAIPGIRGRFRSTPIPELVKETRLLAAQGVKELILVAQDTTQYGLDLNGQQQLPALLHALCQVDSIEWLRLMYAYPYHMNDEIIAALAGEPKIAKYVDMPIQHVSNRMLKRMARRVTRQFTEELIQRLHRTIPGLVLRTSLISGFPGETEEDFQELYDFVAAGHFERMGVFTYSQEEDTPAFTFLEQVPEEIKRERCDLLMQAQSEVAAAWNESQIGRVLRVLIEEYDARQSVYYGRTEWDCPEIDHRVIISGASGQFKTGEFYPVFIKAAQEYDLLGEVPEHEPRRPPQQAWSRRQLPVLVS